MQPCTWSPIYGADRGQLTPYCCHFICQPQGRTNQCTHEASMPSSEVKVYTEGASKQHLRDHAMLPLSKKALKPEKVAFIIKHQLFDMDIYTEDQIPSLTLDILDPIIKNWFAKHDLSRLELAKFKFIDSTESEISTLRVRLVENIRVRRFSIGVDDPIWFIFSEQCKTFDNLVTRDLREDSLDFRVRVLQQERSLFVDLAGDSQSNALQHYDC